MPNLSSLHSRPPLARMMKIHEALLAGKFPNCRKLAAEIEVSAKTIQRDLDFMGDQLGLPIGYDNHRRGFFYTERVAGFPSVQVTEGEVLALLVAQRALEQYRSTPFEKLLQTAFDKLTSGLQGEVTFAHCPGVSFRSNGSVEVDLGLFRNLHTAVRDRLEVSFSYAKPLNTQPEARKARPHHLVCIHGAWYLIAWDLAREAMRTFALSRIKELKLGSRKFERIQGFSIEKFFGNAFGVFTGEGSILVRLAFDPWASRFVRERFWHSSQVLQERPDGTVVLELSLADLNEVLQWVRGWGEHVEVLSPPELRQEVVQSATATLARYRQVSRPRK